MDLSHEIISKEQCPFVKIFEANQTLEEWRSKVSELIFVYEMILEKYQRWSNLASIVATVSGTLTGLLNLSNLGISETEQPTLSSCIKITGAITSGLVATSASISTTLKWGSTIEECQKYLDRTRQFQADLTIELGLPVENRPNPGQFLLEHHDQYTELLRTTPRVPQSELILASKEYRRFK